MIEIFNRGDAETLGKTKLFRSRCFVIEVKKKDLFLATSSVRKFAEETLRLSVEDILCGIRSSTCISSAEAGLP